eukprot:3744386-Rhodomonas_salina.2
MVTPWRFGAFRLTACKSLPIFCSICPSTLLVIGVALTVLSVQCTELNSFATSPPICTGAARGTQLGFNTATQNTRTHNLYRQSVMGASLSFVRLTLQPASTLLPRSCAQLSAWKLPRRGVLGSRLPASLMRSRSFRHGSDDSRIGKRPGSSRKENTRQSPAGSPTRRTQTRLHPDLQRCQTLDHWCDFINTNAEQLDAANTAFAFKVIARLKVFGRNEQLRQPLSKISAHACAIAGEMTANQIGDIFWVHGKMRLRMQESLWQTLGRQAVASADNFSSKNVANTVWSLAKGKMRGKLQRDLVDALSKQAIRTADEFNPQAVANLMWALATMGLRAEAGL